MYKKNYQNRKRTTRRRKTRGRKTYKRRSALSTVVSTSTYVKGSDFMPQSLRTRFNYTQKVNFTSVTTPQTYAFRGNGGFDPDQTGTGSQPIGWDNMNTFYTYNEAYASKIHINVTNRNPGILEYVLTPTTSAAETVLFETGGTLPKARRGYIGASGTVTANKAFSNYANTKDILGINVGSGADVRATFTANPGQQWYWVLYINSVDSATALSMTVTFTITYYVILTGRKTVALS